MTYPVYSLTLHPSYYNNGFFNIGVEVDAHIRRHSGPCTLLLGNSSEKLDARVNRKANLNKTARILSGAKLRDWFYRNFEEMDVIDVVIEAPGKLRLRRIDR